MKKNWKTKPTDGKVWINNSMELQILLACNWNCIACDQHSNMAFLPFVKKATMNMRQIHAFIDEMVTKNAYLGRIRFVGGEPTLHPKFEEIVELMHETLVQTGHVHALELVTNGSKPDIHNKMKKLMRVRVSGEKQKESSHVANLAATPNSLGYEGTMCNAPWHCGFSLNYYGYFPCSSGAGLARLHDWMQYQRLELPMDGVKETWKDLQSLCNFCYHGLKDEDKVRCGTSLHHLNRPSDETWRSLSPWMNGKQPNWNIYAQV